MYELDEKLHKYYPKQIIKKSIRKQVKNSEHVPAFIIEYLLMKICETHNAGSISKAIETVSKVLAGDYIFPSERNKESDPEGKLKYTIFDKVNATSIEGTNAYTCSFALHRKNGLCIDEKYIQTYPNLSSTGAWCIINMEKIEAGNGNPAEQQIVGIQLIQSERGDTSDFVRHRKEFSLEEWIDLICRSVGFEPSALTSQSKWVIIARLIPFVEKNFNFCELGPRGTGKSYLFHETSPYSSLISGGRLFRDRFFASSEKDGNPVIGSTDVVAIDEVNQLKLDEDFSAILKAYMAHGSYPVVMREVRANTSMVFLGSSPSTPATQAENAFSPFPAELNDTAFFDRFHFFLQGWEVPRLNEKSFTDEYGLMADFLSECLHAQRELNHSSVIDEFFSFGNELNHRDKLAVAKTVSGLVKILFPDGQYSKENIRTCLEYALIGRRRIKEQLKMLEEMVFDEVNFSYIDNESKSEYFVQLPGASKDVAKQ